MFISFSLCVFIRRIVRISAIKAQTIPPIKIVKNEYDKDIMLNIVNFSSTITKAYESKSLNELTDYIYKLTSSYNKFYSENRILDEQDNVLRESWLALTKLVLDINLLLLNILGINCPEKM